MSRKRDELDDDESKDARAQMGPLTAVPYQPTMNAIRDELGRTVVRSAVSASKAVLPGLAVGGAVALVIWKIFRIVQDSIEAVRARKARSESIKIKVIESSRRVLDADVEGEGAKDADDAEFIEGEVLYKRDVSPKDDATAAPAQTPPKLGAPLDATTRRARFMRARRLRMRA